MEWLVLETLHEAIRESDDAVSQAEVTRRAGLSLRLVSYAGAWRVLLTKGGELTRDQCNQRLEEARLTG